MNNPHPNTTPPTTTTPTLICTPPPLHHTRPHCRCKVNLIVYNEYPGTPFRPSTPERVQAFRSVLIQVGLETFR